MAPTDQRFKKRTVWSREWLGTVECGCYTCDFSCYALYIGNEDDNTDEVIHQHATLARNMFEHTRLNLEVFNEMREIFFICNMTEMFECDHIKTCTYTQYKQHRSVN